MTFVPLKIVGRCVADDETLFQNMEAAVARGFPQVTKQESAKDGMITLVASGPSVAGQIDVIREMAKTTKIVAIKDAHDYYKETSAVDSVSLSLNSTHQLFDNDKASHFFSEDNSEFLEESGIVKPIQDLDEWFKPVFNVHKTYDLLFGSAGSITPLRYHNYYRQFFCVTSGSIRVKMAPWKCAKYLHPVNDYENYEFRSPVHPLNPQPQFAKDFDKTKFLEFEVQEGYAFYVPPYWWYSIQYSDANTFITCASYVTAMNCISNLPNLGIHWLQQQNITKKITKIPAKKDDHGESAPIISKIDNANGENSVSESEKGTTDIGLNSDNPVSIETETPAPESPSDIISLSI
jgi:hypothetical protein